MSKIQDPGLTDYEVRDLNDEINKLLREKGHWENQILALGGANYKRGIPSMLGGGDVGVGGKGGYKYFGRAKDLPGVKEMFDKTQREGEERGRTEKYQRFQNLPSSYFGDEDEDDGLLLEEEGKAEEAEWSERYLQVVQGLRRDLREGQMDVSDEEEVEVPSIPRPPPESLKESMKAFADSFSQQYAQPETAEEVEGGKRTQPEDGTEGAGGKRQKGADGQARAVGDETREETGAVGYSIFSAEDLQTPSVPDGGAIEKMILQAKKRQLREEYVGSN